MKPTFKSPYWSWGILALALLFIFWSASLFLSVNRLAAVSWGLAIFLGIATLRRQRQPAKRKRTAAASRGNEASFHVMADTAPVMIWVSDANQLYSYVNKVWLEFTGRSLEQELGKGWLEMVHPEDLPKYLETYHSAFEARREFRTEYRLKRRDGVYRWIVNTGVPRLMRNDNFNGYIGSCIDITEHRQAEDSLRESEDALRQSEERYRTLIERLTDGVYRSTPEGKFIEANPAMIKMLGYANKEELLAIDIKKQLYFDEQEREIIVDKLRDAGGDEIDVFRLRRKDGREVWVEDHGQLIYDAAGKVIYHEGILRDISARKRTEEALRESEERYRSVIDALAEGVVLYDGDGNMIACNASAERILGLTSQEMRGRRAADPRWRAIHEDDTPFPGEAHPAIVSLRTGQPCANIVMGIQKSTGELTWISINSKPLARADELKPYAVVVSFYDITERKWAEEALRESEERYRLLAENSLDLIELLDLDGNVLYASPSHYYVIGYTPNELVHQNLFSVVHAEDIPRTLTAINSLLGSNTRKTIELRMLKKNGDWIEMEALLSGIPGPGNAVHRVLLSARDITARKRAEEHIKASLKEKEVLLKEIHHRVKNNLQIISSLLNLQSGYIQDEHAGEMFKESRNRVKSMALIHEKLYQSKDLARIDFAEYVRNLTTHLFRSYGVNTHAVGLKINVDKVLLDIDTAIPCGLIVNELVTNSLKYAFPPGVAGEIHVDLHQENDGRLALVVSDNGAGLPPDFDLQKTESLGLQLVSTLTDQLEGTIVLEQNRGTTFKILLQPHNGLVAHPISDGVSNSDLPF
jgi:PAS domain S-box-containing protein